jgi:hypothetical protein
MILQIFRDLREQILAYETGVNYVSFDKGQFDNPTKFGLPFSTGLVLIDIKEGIDWEEFQSHQQVGIFQFCAKIAVRLPDDSFYEKNQEQNLDAIEIEDLVHNAIILMKNISRTKTHTYYIDSLFIIEHTYQSKCEYKPLTSQNTIKKRLKVEINLEFNK